MKIPNEIIDFSLNIKENISAKQVEKSRDFLYGVIFYSKHIEINFHFKSQYFFLMQIFASVPKH